MKHRHFSKAIVCVVLCFCTAISSILCLNGTSSVSAADKGQLSQLQQQSQEIENQQKQIDEKLEQARKDIENQEKLKETLEEKITSVEKQIDNLNKTVEEYNKQINRLQSGIDEKEAAIDDDYQKLRQRLRIIYMAGDASNLEIILGAKSFDDFIDKMDLVKCLGEADEKLISGLQDSIADINSDKEKLEKDRQEVNEKKKKLEDNRAELEKLQKECDSVIAALKSSQNTLNEDNKKYEQEKKQLENQITQWFKDYFAANGAEILPSDTSAGTYAWPAPYCDVVTTEFQEGVHRGMDIACNGSAYGLPIVAAQDGTVVNVNRTDNWGSGWGYYLMIDHGGSFATLYAHCSVIVAEVGDTVKKGQVIGYIGNTGRSYGAHLHFECWYNGTRYNPRYALGTA
ncbi:MAG: peptidoglycan DD-metalloendopeptidase family protein [Oscillospiraceae bacterium]|nr:peptidoglycan DD-metalloendopeptidase family protein [Oscillospiraceae bacterium]